MPESVEMTPELAAEVRSAMDRATAHDGVPPFNEAARRALTGERHHEVAHWVERADGKIIAAAQLDLGDRNAQLFVVPEQRGAGHGTAMIETLLANDPAPAIWWSFRALPAAAHLAERYGLGADRELLIMRRDLDEHAPVTTSTPDGYVIDNYGPDDLDDLVATNAAAFAHHPEQGRVTREEFEEQLAEVDGRDVIIVRHGGRLVGFHWTKQHDADRGEVYVIGVHPDHAGHGLGQALLEAGLTRLADQGVREVFLYTEASLPRVVRFYELAGFKIVNHDIAYSKD